MVDHLDEDLTSSRFQRVDLSGSRFQLAHLNGVEFSFCELVDTRFRIVEMTGVVMRGVELHNVEISGDIGNLTINGVEVKELVEAELDRRHPERVQLRALGKVDDFRAMWETIERLWADTTARAGRLPEQVRQERVDGEWSFAETLRHLLFITDAWASRTILDEERPYHPLGVTQTWYKLADSAALGIDHDASPQYDEVLAARADRMAVIRRVVDNLTDAELGRICARTPAPGYPEEDRPVSECLWVVMEEEVEHHRYATRDLTTLEAR